MWLNRAESPWNKAFPHNSTLGPILFNLFVSPLGGICWAQGIKFAGYADNTQNYIILVELGPNFLLKQRIFLFGDKLLSVVQHGFLRSAELSKPNWENPSADLRKPCWKTGKACLQTKIFSVLRENLDLVQLKSCYQIEREAFISKIIWVLDLSLIH